MAEETIPTARVEIKPPRFTAKPELTPQEELEEARRIIEEGKANNLQKVIIPHDLHDLAWQKLSQEGYKLKRTILQKLGNIKSATQDELDQNRIQFEINLVEFNNMSR